MTHTVTSLHTRLAYTQDKRREGAGTSTLNNMENVYHQYITPIMYETTYHR